MKYISLSATLTCLYLFLIFKTQDRPAFFLCVLKHSWFLFWNHHRNTTSYLYTINNILKLVFPLLGCFKKKDESLVCEKLSKKILSYFFFFFFFLNAVTTTVCVAYLTFKITPPYCTVQLYELVSKYIPPEVLDVDLFLLGLGQSVQYTFQQDFFSLNQQLKKS